MLSHYGRYIYEREGKSIIENEKGFVTFLFTRDFCYMEDIYVAPEFRNQGATYEFVREVEKLALLKGYKRLVGTVKPTANGATRSLKGMLAHGFEVDSCDGELIWFKKDIQEAL